MASKQSPLSGEEFETGLSSCTEFEEELGELVRAAEAEGVDLVCARDIDAGEEGYKYMIEISRVRTRGE